MEIKQSMKTKLWVCVKFHQCSMTVDISANKYFFDNFSKVLMTDFIDNPVVTRPKLKPAKTYTCLR